MKRLSVINPISDKRWDEFVGEHPCGGIYHLSDWAAVLSKSFHHIQPLYLILRENGSRVIQAALPLCLVKSCLTGCRLVSLPFATLCDPLISSSEEFEILFEEAIRLKNQLNADYIRINTMHTWNLMNEGRVKLRRFYKHHYLKIDREPEKLKKSFHRTCVRQRIKRAESSQVTKRRGMDEEDLRSFYSLHVMTRKRNNLPPHPFRFLRKTWEVFNHSNRVNLLLADYRGKSIGGIITFTYKNRVSVEYAASDERFRHLSPNHLLFWQAIQRAYNDGYDFFDFGRTSPEDKGLMHFKNRWGTEVVDIPEAYYPKETHKTNSNNHPFAPCLARAFCYLPSCVIKQIGHLAYRHLG